MFKIKELRQKAGLTQEQLADRIGVTRHYLSYIENDHKKPSWELMEKIAQELHTTVKELIEDKPA